MVDYSALDRMQQLLQRWDLSFDARAIFLRCYAIMTENMQAALLAGEFKDGPWVHNLLEQFAIYYFAALESYERGSEQTPPVWRVAFDAAMQPGTHALQNLLLGVNAHINYDLVFAVVNLLDKEWPGLEPARRQVRYHDYSLVNIIIDRTTNTVQDQVLEQWSPQMSLLDDFMGNFDEWFIALTITGWRDHVWEQAIRYIELPDAASREVLRQKIEEDSLTRASAILGNEGPLGFLKAL